MECVRNMIHAQGLYLEFWVKVVNMTIYMNNRCPIKVLDSKAPQETWMVQSPMYLINKFLVVKHLCIFLMKREAN